jgi:hypothetical protein
MEEGWKDRDGRIEGRRCGRLGRGKGFEFFFGQSVHVQSELLKAFVDFDCALEAGEGWRRDGEGWRRDGRGMEEGWRVRELRRRREGWRC